MTDEILKTVFFAVAIILITVYWISALSSGMKQYKKAQESRYWGKTEGETAHSKLESHFTGEHSYARPEIRYKYTVLGRKFEGDRVTFGYKSTPNWLFASFMVKIKYPVGKKVEVYYNKNNPLESVLIRSRLFVCNYFIGAFIAFAIDIFIIKGLIDGTI